MVVFCIKEGGGGGEEKNRGRLERWVLIADICIFCKAYVRLPG